MAAAGHWSSSLTFLRRLGTTGVADGAESAGQNVVAVGLVPVGVARVAERFRAARAGTVVVKAPSYGVGEGLGEQRGLGIHGRQFGGQESGEGLLEAADDIAGVTFQFGRGLFAERWGVWPLLVE